ncbi:hypothetical protein AAVH_18057 [Aphelenchoides avenae]|nr:hypothetical protein AAVH_18057 [Aphelenchus avenae]
MNLITIAVRRVLPSVMVLVLSLIVTFVFLFVDLRMKDVDWPKVEAILSEGRQIDTVLYYVYVVAVLVPGAVIVFLVFACCALAALLLQLGQGDPLDVLMNDIRHAPSDPDFGNGCVGLFAILGPKIKFRE